MHKVGTLQRTRTHRAARRPGAILEGTISDSRRIPEATVARLPLYYRALLETADQEIGTVSSERLAELAGVNAAKVRKDLSYLGSYGTRGVGYDVDYLLHEISRELGLTHDWPVAIVGMGNLGQALANYRGFGARGFRIVALVDTDPDKIGRQVGELTVEALDDLPAITRARGHRDRDDRGARARGAGSGRSARRRRDPVDPQLRAHGGHRARRRVAAQGRPRDRAPDPVLLPAATRACSPFGHGACSPFRHGAGAQALRRRREGTMTTRAAITGYPVNLVLTGRRCVVVGAGRIAARKIDALLDAGADVHVIAPAASADVEAWADAGRLTLVASSIQRRRPRRCVAGDHRDRRPGRRPCGVQPRVRNAASG